MEFLAGSSICCSSRGRYVTGREQRVRGARLDVICSGGSCVVESSAVATLQIYPDILCAIIDRYWLCIRQRLVDVDVADISGYTLCHHRPLLALYSSTVGGCGLLASRCQLQQQLSCCDTAASISHPFC
jgi:hypothetical protein